MRLAPPPAVRFHFGGVYPRHGIRCSYSLTRQIPTPSLIAWEAAAFAVMRRQRRAALAEIAESVALMPMA